MVVALHGCSSEKEGTLVELFVMPEAYVVDGHAYKLVGEAVNAVVGKSPKVIQLPSCGAMPTQRVIDAMKELEGKHKARLVMSVVSDGERGCPSISR